MSGRSVATFTAAQVAILQDAFAEKEHYHDDLYASKSDFEEHNHDNVYSKLNHGHAASGISVSTTSFNGRLGSEDTNLQTALNTLDDSQ